MGITVNAQPGSIINNYDIHDNEVVNVGISGEVHETSEIRGEDEPLAGDEDATVRAIKEAVEAVMEARDEKGGRVFAQQKQWSGVYLILHEMGLYKGTDSGFAEYLRALGVVPKEPLHLRQLELFKGFEDRRPWHFNSWKPDGSKREREVYAVARIFREEIEKRMHKK